MQNIESHPVFAAFSPETRAAIAANANAGANYYVVVATDKDGVEWRSCRSYESDAQGDAAALRAAGYSARVDIQAR